MKLGELLLQDKVITQEQLQKALDYQKKNPGTQIGDALVTLGFVDAKTIAGVLAKQKP
jgi:type IV pilus assembly protein PilB